MSEYIQQVAAQSRGRVLLDVQASEICQGHTRPEELQPLHHTLLTFFLTQPHERHTHDDLIEATWPGEMNKEGVLTDALY